MCGPDGDSHHEPKNLIESVWNSDSSNHSTVQTQPSHEQQRMDSNNVGGRSSGEIPKSSVLPNYYILCQIVCTLLAEDMGCRNELLTISCDNLR